MNIPPNLKLRCQALNIANILAVDTEAGLEQIDENKTAGIEQALEFCTEVFKSSVPGIYHPIIFQAREDLIYIQNELADGNQPENFLLRLQNLSHIFLGYNEYLKGVKFRPDLDIFSLMSPEEVVYGCRYRNG